MRTMKHFALATMAAAALALAGCGGGGSGGTASTPTPPPPTPVTLPASLPAEYAPDAGSMRIAAGSSDTSNGVKFTCASGGDDCMVTVGADGMVSSTGGTVTAALTQAVADIVASRSNEATRTTQRTAANTAIEAAQTAANGVSDDSTDADVTAAEMAIETATMKVNEATALTAAERAELMTLITAASSTLSTAKTSRMAALDAKKKAAAKEGGALFAGMDGGRGTAGTVDLAVVLTSVTDKHDGSAAVVATSVTVDGTPLTPVPTVKATNTMVPSLGMWKGTELTGANTAGTVTQTTVVYTDIEPNTSKPFDEQYPGAADDSTLIIDADTSGDDHVSRIKGCKRGDGGTFQKCF